MGKLVNFKVNEDKLKEIRFFNINKDDEKVLEVLKRADFSKSNKCNKYNDIERYKFKVVKDIINNRIVNKQFRDRVLSIIELIKVYMDKSNLVLNSNHIIGYNDNDYLFVALKDNHIEYAIENEEEANYGRYGSFNDKYYVMYNNISNTSLYNMCDKSKRKSIINSTNISLFDKNDCIISKKDTIVTNNYEIFSEDNNEYSIPDKFNNVTIDRVSRVGNNVIRNVRVTYLNKHYIDEKGEFLIDKDLINKDNYYIGYNYKPNNRDIPDDIYYQEIDYEDYIKVKRK